MARTRLQSLWVTDQTWSSTGKRGVNNKATKIRWRTSSTLNLTSEWARVSKGTEGETLALKTLHPPSNDLSPWQPLSTRYRRWRRGRRISLCRSRTRFSRWYRGRIWRSRMRWWCWTRRGRVLLWLLGWELIRNTIINKKIKRAAFLQTSNLPKNQPSSSDFARKLSHKWIQ